MEIFKLILRYPEIFKYTQFSGIFIDDDENL